MLIVSPRAKAACRLVIVLASIATVPACKAGLDPVELYPVVIDSTIVFALNGSAPGTPTALDLFNVATFRANESFEYDLAFDINADGLPVVIPAAALATNYSMPHDVGLQVVPNATFLSLTSAPTAGYRLDTALVAPVGAVIAVESHDLAHCPSSTVGQSFFAKIVITAVNPATRSIAFTLGVNRRCGVHGLVPD
jgi:hypothetical protein